jgi:hypothetical protein
MSRATTTSLRTAVGAATREPDLFVFVRIGLTWSRIVSGQFGQSGAKNVAEIDEVCGTAIALRGRS